MWHKVMMVARREYLTSVRTKAFLIMIVMAPIMMGGGLIAIALFKNQKDISDKRIVVVDRTGLLAERLKQSADARNEAAVLDEETGEQVEPRYVIESAAPDEENPAAQRVELSSRVKNKEIAAFVEIGPEVIHPGENPDAARVSYHAETAALDEAREWIVYPLNGHIREQRLDDAGVDEQTRLGLLDWIPVDGLGLFTIDENTGLIEDAQRRTKAALSACLPR